MNKEFDIDRLVGEIDFEANKFNNKYDYELSLVRKSK